MIRSIFLLSTAFFLAVSGYKCNGTTTIEAPSDLSQPTFYPSGWTPQQPLPQVDPEQQCMLVINIPLGVYAKVTFRKYFGIAGGMYVLYSNNKIDVLLDNDEQPYIFSAPWFKINLGTPAQGGLNSTGFAFEIEWSRFPDVQKNVVNIYKGQAPVVVTPNDALTSFIGGQNSMISLVGFNLIDTSMNYLLRQSAIFAGDSFNGEFVGTLSQVVKSGMKLTTYRNKMSVYTFGLSQQIDYPLFMAQDYDDSVNIFSYLGANCPNTGNCNVTLSGRMGPSVTVTDFNGSEIIKDIATFPDSAVITVYENAISNTTMIATLTKDNYKQVLPLEMKGTIKYYGLSGSGSVVMSVTRDTSRASRL